MKFSQLLLFLTVASNAIGYTIYLYYIFKNKIKPHALTFLVWSLIIGINFLAQLFSGLGISSLILATNLAGCFIIFITCLFKGYTSYDKIDWICLFLGILAIVLWLATKTPLYSVIFSCLIDLFAFAPSFRKSFYKPNEDSIILYLVSSLEYLFSFPSYRIFSFIVLAYPIVVLTLDFTYAMMMLIRRIKLKAE